MKLTCISDTHQFHRWMKGQIYDIPEGDVLIHAGDACNRGTREEFIAFAQWFGALPHKNKIFIPGNHDICLQDSPDSWSPYTIADKYGFTILLDKELILNGIKLYGSPWTSEFYNWAFMLPRDGKELYDVWQKIPSDTDVLITHGPPFGILDEAGAGKHVGCQHLRDRVDVVQPKFHVFGHIHYAAGYFDNGTTKFINAACCNEQYYPINPPQVFAI